MLSRPKRFDGRSHVFSWSHSFINFTSPVCDHPFIGHFRRTFWFHFFRRGALNTEPRMEEVARKEEVEREIMRSVVNRPISLILPTF